MQTIDVASQTSPLKGIQPQSSVAATEEFPETQLRIGLVPFLISFNKCPTDIPESDKHTMTTLNDAKNLFLSQQPHISKKGW